MIPTPSAPSCELHLKAGCTLLKEFASVQCELYLDDTPPPLTSYVCWPDWKSLNRLALHNPYIGQTFLAFIAGLPHLTHLAIDNPDWDEPVSASSMRSALKQSNPKLQRAIIIEYETTPGMATWNTPGFELEFVKLQISGSEIENWFSDHLNAGTLWEY